MKTTDIFPALNIPLAEGAHHALIDLLAACLGPRDEEILMLRLNGSSQNDIAWITGSSQATVSRRLGRMMEAGGFESLGLRLRGRSEQAVPPEQADMEVPVDLRGGLRFARHERAAYPHRRRVRVRECWCAKKVAA